MEEQSIKLHYDLVSLIPERLRPDVTELVEKTISEFISPAITEWKGYRFPVRFDASMAEWQYSNWSPTEDDVLIAAYPKTGTTWMNLIVKTLIYFDDKELLEMLKTYLTRVHTVLERGTPVNYDILDKLPWKRKIWGTHLPAPLINMERLKKNGCKIICTIRNPKDQVVSWFHMTRNMSHYNLEPMRRHFPKDWNAFFESYIHGKQPLVSKEGEWYLDYVLSWHTYRNESNVLFVVFEDLLKNPAKEIRKIANFLGVRRSEEEIEEIVEATSFRKAKEEAPDVDRAINFFRKGEVGDWKNHLTVAQSQLMDEKIKQKLVGTDIRFIYEL
ncbi:sulfotransferase 1C2-like [Clavelina lepadiformis]|uniref:sulfotransferase 1C2-like n=1 Tax=Clavelina lepadiformis TaxID=159417 RepID=UPI0040421D47